MAVVQGHFDPWHPRLLDKTEAQLDAILEAYSLTFPQKLKFERRRNSRTRLNVEALAVKWSDKLVGKGLEAHRSKVSFRIPDRFRAKAARPGGQR